MQYTDKGAPYPSTDRSDPNNPPAHLKQLADWVSARPGISAMSTTQRNALTGVELWEGRVIANTTTGQLEKRTGTRWDPTGGLLPLLSQAQIDALSGSALVPGATVLNTSSNAAEVIGTDGIVRGLTAGLFGDGSDGDVTITGAVTLTRPMFYRNLTIAASGVLDTAGQRVYVRDVLNFIPGSVIRNNATSSAAGANVSTADFGSGQNLPLGGTGGSGGFGGSFPGQGAGGGQGDDGRTSATPLTLTRVRALIAAITSGLVGGGAGGRGGYASDSQAGSSYLGSGLGGFGGGVVLLLARIITGTGTVEAAGGPGAAASGPGGAGGGGGGGGAVVVITTATVPGTVTLRAPGGTAGAGAAGASGQSSGSSGSPGSSGFVLVLPLTA